MEKHINKVIFLEGHTCPTKAWYYFHGHHQQKPSSGDQHRMEEGRQICELARQLYPEGSLVIQCDVNDAAKETLKLLNNNEIKILFEATFISASLITRADILIKLANGWHLIEVRSCTNFDDKTDGSKEKYLDDMAYTTMVISQSLAIEKISILSLSKDFRLGMPIVTLFLMTDVTNVVKFKAKAFAQSQASLVKQVVALNIPKSTWKYACKDCEFFASDCLGKDIIDPIFEISRIGEKNCLNLFGQQCYQIGHIPTDFKLTKSQTIIRNAVVDRKVFQSNDLSKRLLAMQWPVYYLDFETVKTAYPLYPSVSPHEQVVTQYSLHKLASFASEPSHFEYLADPTCDCRQALTIKLINDLGTKGAIVVYSPFEKTILTGLKKLCPDFNIAIDAIIDRLVDLQAIIKDGYYDPRFHGSYSIKDVLPILVDGMNYDQLEVQNGEMAIAAFVQMAKNNLAPAQVQVLRRQLLAYCCQDTLAMLMLHRELSNIRKLSA